MTETELDRIVVRLIGDNSSYRKMTKDAIRDTQDMEKSVGETAGRTAASFHMAGRGLHMLAHGLSSLMTGKTGPEQVARSVGMMSMAIGHQFGMAGMAVGAGVMVISHLFAQAIKDFGMFGQAANQAAQEAVSAFATGTKAEQAMASATAKEFQERMKEAAEGSTGWWSRLRQSRVGTFQTREEFFTHKVTQATKEQAEANQIINRLMAMRIVQIANLKAETEKSTEATEKGLEELNKRAGSVGVASSLKKDMEEYNEAQIRANKLTDDWHKSFDRAVEAGVKGFSFFGAGGARKYVEELKTAQAAQAEAATSVSKVREKMLKGALVESRDEAAKLDAKMNAIGVDPGIASLREMRATIAAVSDGSLRFKMVLDEINRTIERTKDVAVAGLMDKFGREAKFASLKPHQREVEDLIDKYNITDDSIKNMMRSQAEFAEVASKGGALLLKQQEELAHFGKSEAQYAAEQLDKWGDSVTANTLRQNEMQSSLNQMTKEVNKYNLAMGGATKADLAYAEANDPVAAALAKQKTLLEEGIRVTNEVNTPAEKYAQTHREMSQLVNSGAITQETYNRQMAKAAQEMNGVREAIQGVSASSADAVSKVLAYQDTLRFGNAPKPLAPAQTPQAAAAGSAEAQSRMEGNRWLELIYQEIQKANQAPQAPNLNPANFGGGGNQ